ncbi:PREDICTED: sushi, nidogen and EGF-like domain-containing protein 1 [Priapulus caudatus]|uniref:Sushi, nidogen and EGF-like domain-containing protein 1 n=1 Tax=Priapulus caudatus TaxID=37621 RepID=A0ABM1DPJ6_PRICU|nr:PREDICTED: sushi, nidogen and EGF-like domain-containing protein 1 [Priapulus caudatus]
MSLGIWSWILASLFICISAAPSDVSKSAGLPRGVLRGSSENACAKFPCRHGGRCQAAGVGLYTCTCPWKFVGDHCETLYQPCHPNPCRNRGACNRDATQTTYMCTCMHGFTGRDRARSATTRATPIRANMAARVIGVMVTGHTFARVTTGGRGKIASIQTSLASGSPV